MGVVLKYGGTSVASTEKLMNIASYIKTIKDEEPIVIVVSAMGKTTDELVSLAKEFTNDLHQREMDTLLSIGEQKTIALMTMALHKEGIDAISLTGAQAGFITTPSYTKGIIKDINITRITGYLNAGKVVVVAGFQGMTEDGDITTLGRGGSDTSAVALAAKLGYRCEIYTDVDGIHTVDPRYYPQSKKMDQISYTECMEMSVHGAGIIETRAVELAKKYNVKLYIAKSLSEKGSGTMIMNESYLFEDKPITGIAITESVVMLTIQGKNQDNQMISQAFELISQANINLDMISQSIDQMNQVVISFSIDEDDLIDIEKLVKANPQVFKDFKVSVKKNLVKLSLIGVGMASHFGVASKVFTTLNKANISFYHVSTSEISISCTIDNHYKNEAVHILSKEFHL